VLGCLLPGELLIQLRYKIRLVAYQIAGCLDSVAFRHDRDLGTVSHKRWKRLVRNVSSYRSG
jgi:hypothetical protein